MKRLLPAIAAIGGLTAAGCGVPASQAEGSAPREPSAARVDYAIVIHGGVGVIPPSTPEEEREPYYAALRQALEAGHGVLEAGGASLDAIEVAIRSLEDSPLFNAGRGAVYTHDGGHELDASVMDGKSLECGSVAGLKTVKNPISLARQVMSHTHHVFLAWDGAEQFASRVGAERVEPGYFDDTRRYEQWQRALEEERASGNEVWGKFSTVGAVARDRQGDLAAGTSSGGLTNKRFGRIGDVPIIGAGTYANNRTAALSCSGVGEQFIRHTVAHDISALMEYRGLGLREAAEAVIHGKLEPGEGGVIGVDRDGGIVAVYNTAGMFRGAADSTGRFEVKIWD